MANRQVVCSFDGHTGANAPSDGNIVSDATALRTGSGGLHVTAVALTRSTLSFGVPSNPGVTYTRFALKIVSLPGSSNRVLYSYNTTPGATHACLGLTSGGKLILRSGGSTTAIATSTKTLSTGVWYTVEIAFSAANQTAALRIDNVDQWGGSFSGWIFHALGTNGSTLPTMVVGALDTAATTMEYYLDDLAIDDENWCKPGRVYALAPDSLISNAGSWTIPTGGTALAAVQTNDDDTAYILSPTSTATPIIFSFADLPVTNAVAGFQLMARAKRDAATGTTVTVSERVGNWVNSWGTFSGAGAAYSNLPVPCSQSPWKVGLTAGDFNSLTFGVSTNSANKVRVTWLTIDVDCFDDGFGLESARIAIFSCDDGDLSDFASTTGSPVADTGHLRTANSLYAVKCPYNATTASYVSCMANLGQLNGVLGEWYGRAYIYLTNLPSGAFVQGFEVVNFGGLTTSRKAGIRIGSSGELTIMVQSTTGASSINGLITTGVWHRLEWRFRAESSNSASDGEIEVKLNGTQVCLSTGLDMGSTGASFTNISQNIGIFNPANMSNATGGVYLDDIAFDFGSWVGDSTIIDLVPNAFSGGASWSVVGGGTRDAAVAESPSNSDTTYVLSPSGVSGQELTYTFPALPAEASPIIQAIRTRIHAKRDAATNAVISYTRRVNAVGVASTAITTTSAYVWTNSTKYVGDFGHYRDWMINFLSLVLANNNTTQARVSNIRVSVEYVPFAAQTKSLVASGEVVDTAGTTQYKLVRAVPDVTPTLQGTYTAAAQGGFNPPPRYSLMSNDFIGSAGLVGYPDDVDASKTKISWVFTGPFLLAQHIGGTAKIIVAAHKVNASSTIVPKVYLWVMKTDGTKRATLASVLGTTPLTTTLTNVQIGPFALTGADIQANDRIVLELGYDESSGNASTAYTEPGGGSGISLAVSGATSSFGQPYMEFDSVILPGAAKDLIVDGIVQATATLEVVASGSVAEVKTKEVVASGLVQAAQTLDAIASGLVQTTATLEVVADGIVDLGAVTLTLEVVADGIVQTTRTLEATADAYVVQELIKELVASGLVQATVTIDVDTDGLVQETLTLELTADGLIQGDGFAEFVADGIVQAVFTSEVDADGLVQETEVIELDTDGYVVLEQTAEVVATGLVKGAETIDLIADGLVRDTLTSDLDADGYVLMVVRLDVTADALVQQTAVNELVADGWIVAQVETEVEADGYVVLVRTLDLTADAIVQRTQILDAVVDGVIQVTVVAELTADGVVKQLNVLREVTVDALVMESLIREAVADGIVRQTVVVEVVADGQVVIHPGTIKADARTTSALQAITRSVASIDAILRSVETLVGYPRVTEQP